MLLSSHYKDTLKKKNLTHINSLLGSLGSHMFYCRVYSHDMYFVFQMTNMFSQEAETPKQGQKSDYQKIRF